MLHVCECIHTWHATRMYVVICVCTLLFMCILLQGTSAWSCCFSSHSRLMCMYVCIMYVSSIDTYRKAHVRAYKYYLPPKIAPH